ncbi:hypothetical protein LPJ53_005409, partial [Coemansia erecta]
MSSLAELIDTLTAGSQDTLDVEQITQLKRQCRDGGPPAVQQAFTRLMERLGARQAHVRLLSMQAIDELFVRSHAFRLLATARLADILGLALGAYGQRAARPAEQAAELRAAAGQTVLRWARRFGGAYPRLVYGAWHVRHAEGLRPASSRSRRSTGGVDAGRQECAGRMVDAARVGLHVYGARMEAAMRVAARCVGVLEDSDELFAESADAASDAGSVDADEVLAVVAGNRQRVSVTLSAADMLGPQETADTAPVYAALRDALRECLAHRVRVQKWAAWLGRAARVDGVETGEVLAEARRWEARLDEALELGGRVGVDVAQLGRVRAAVASGVDEGGDEGGDEDEFEDVDVASIRRRQAQRPETRRTQRNAVFALLHEGAALAADPTYVDARELLALRRKHAPRPRPRAPPSALEEELMRSAPVVPFDTDLLHWGKRTVPLDGVEVRHRFLGGARDTPQVGGAALERMQMRA